MLFMNLGFRHVDISAYVSNNLLQLNILYKILSCHENQQIIATSFKTLTYFFACFLAQIIFTNVNVFNEWIIVKCFE